MACWRPASRKSRTALKQPGAGGSLASCSRRCARKFRHVTARPTHSLERICRNGSMSNSEPNSIPATVLVCEDCGEPFKVFRVERRGMRRRFCDECQRQHNVDSVDRHRHRARKDMDGTLPPGLAIRTVREVAEILDVSHDTVVRTEARALAKLRKHPDFAKVWAELKKQRAEQN